jgi:hypothetical protein
MRHAPGSGQLKEDGEWTCCSCGHPLTPSLTGLRAIRSDVRDLELRAA